MKRTLIIMALAVFALPALAQRKKKDKDKDEGAQVPVTVVTVAPVPVMSDAKDSLSYAFGITMANNMKSQGVESLNFEVFSEGVKEAFSNREKMTDEQAMSYLKDFFATKKLKEDEATRKRGEQFLEENKKKEGVVVLPNGLQYKVLVKGNSNLKPSITDKVKTHYHGTLIDGTVFDSSVERNQPASFPVNAVIRGWVEALQLMNVGDKWELYIPYDLAYGARATGKIKPFSTLIFQVELLEIEK